MFKQLLLPIIAVLIHGAAAAQEVRISTISDPRSAKIEDWGDVINARPTRPVTHNKIEYVQDIKLTGAGDANLDYYALTIDSAGQTAEQVMIDIRRHLSDYIYHGTIYKVEPLDQESHARWNSSSPVGAVMVFQLAPAPTERGAVIVTSADSTHFVFSTVSMRGISGPGDHPVSGNRAFGVHKNDDRSLTIFTKAADRRKGDNPVYETLGSDRIFAEGARVWHGLMSNLRSVYRDRSPRNDVEFRQTITETRLLEAMGKYQTAREARATGSAHLLNQAIQELAPIRADIDQRFANSDADDAKREARKKADAEVLARIAVNRDPQWEAFADLVRTACSYITPAEAIHPQPGSTDFEFIKWALAENDRRLRAKELSDRADRDFLLSHSVVLPHSKIQSGANKHRDTLTSCDREIISLILEAPGPINSVWLVNELDYRKQGGAVGALFRGLGQTIRTAPGAILTGITAPFIAIWTGFDVLTTPSAPSGSSGSNRERKGRTPQRRDVWNGSPTFDALRGIAH